MRSKKTRSRGSALTAVLVAVGLCGALAASVTMTSMGRQRAAVSTLSRERAFDLAEAGVDWALTQIRINRGVVPATPLETRVVAGTGTFTVRYSQGDANGNDDDGDGDVDDAEERDYATVVSTGEAGGIRRSVDVLFRKAVEIPGFGSSIQVNVNSPVLDLSGNAFTISGEDHFIDGTLDPSRPTLYGVASPADPAALLAQVPSGSVDQITGTGGVPSIGTVAPMDLARIMEQASGAASIVLPPGTYTPTGLGTPTLAGIVSVYCAGDLHIAGGGTGAGVLAVDGDLTISGDFSWTGIILVRGMVTMAGGGSSTRIIGALAVGEEITNHSGSTSVGVAGTVDILYSSDAVELASQRLIVMRVMSWHETGSPSP